MSDCVFCRMLSEKKIHLPAALDVYLLRDSRGTAYYQALVPTCEAHGGMAGIIQPVAGDAPGNTPDVTLYDETKNFFVEPENEG